MATRYGNGRRIYTWEERAAFVAEVERRYQGGEASLTGIARKLGLSHNNYFDWRKAISARSAKQQQRALEALTPEFRTVEMTAMIPISPEPLAVKTPSNQDALTLFAPSGHWVTGLSLQSTAALLRALS